MVKIDVSGTSSVPHHPETSVFNQLTRLVARKCVLEGKSEGKRPFGIPCVEGRITLKFDNNIFSGYQPCHLVKNRRLWNQLRRHRLETLIFKQLTAGNPRRFY
jgi:hypothetical protein